MGYPTKKYREKKVKYEKRSWFLSFRQSPTVGVLDDEKSCCRKISERLTTIIMENHPAHSDYVYALVSLQIGEKRLYRKHISSSEKRNCTRSIEQSTRKSKRKESVGKRGEKDRSFTYSGNIYTTVYMFLLTYSYNTTLVLLCLYTSYDTERLTGISSA